MKFLGMGPLDIEILKLVGGSNERQNYAQLGVLCSSLYQFKLSERMFRPRFLRLCSQGLIRWRGEDDKWKYFKERKYKLTEKGSAFIRELQILFGGNYSYYRYFSGKADDLDRFTPHKHSFHGATDLNANFQRNRREMRRRMRSEIVRQNALENRKVIMDFGHRMN